VPWIKPAQRLFKDEDLPKAPEKRALYELARAELLAAGYVEIGMDHFALPNDSLSKSQQAGTLHRNFMGYADLRTDIMLGLGVSAISESPGCFHQNEKVLPIYERLLNENKIPSLRGHLLSQEDRQQREKILRFMTKGATPLDAAEVQDAKSFLAEMINDQLVEIQNNTLRITTKGRPFLRNACVFFDAQLRRKQPTTQTFSSSI
jgi:oxygen-independent coproporphyrinogen-3 oxidase